MRMYNERWIQVEGFIGFNRQCWTKQASRGIENVQTYIAEIAPHFFWHCIPTWLFFSRFFGNVLGCVLCCHYSVTLLGCLYGPCNEILGMLHVACIFQFEALGGLFGSLPRWNHNLQLFGGMRYTIYLRASLDVCNPSKLRWVLVVIHQNFAVCVFVDWKWFSTCHLTGIDIMHKTRHDVGPKQKLEC